MKNSTIQRTDPFCFSNLKSRINNLNAPRLRQPVVILTTIICSLGTYSSQAQSNIYINSATGNDGTGTGTSGAPYASIYQGYTSASAGDTLNLEGTFTWTDAVELGDVAGNGFNINKNIYMRGVSAQSTIIQAHASRNTADRRIFTIPNNITVGFEKLTLQNGRGSSGGAIMAGSNSSNSGTITLRDCEILDNVSTTNYAGGLYLNGGLLISENSTYASNEALFWGAAIYAYYGRYDLSNNTFTGHNNHSVIHCIFGTGDLFYTNNTIAHNTIAASFGWAVYNETTGYNIYMQNNLVVENKNAGTPRDWYYGSSYSNAMNNMIETAVTGLTDGVDGNVIGTGGTYLESSLNINGSSKGTRTLAVTSNLSESVNGGLALINGTALVPANDQRDMLRSETLDIGSYEFNGSGLPIELGSFEAELTEKNTVQLKWQTISERDNERFELYRSEDGKNWRLIHSEPGAGNSTTEQLYATFDSNPKEGSNYYQLKQIDFNGASETFDVVHVEVVTNDYFVYPNPAVNALSISGNRDIRYVIRDAAGKTHLEGIVQGSELIDISKLSPGIYLVNSEGRSTKFIKR